MGWRGTLRTMAAAARAAERESQRRAKAKNAANISANASSAVDQWQDHLNSLTSIHLAVTDQINWMGISGSSGPVEPRMETAFQTGPKSRLDAFKPSFLHIFKGGSAKYRAKLEAMLHLAQQADLKAYAQRKDDHAKEIAEWNAEVSLARRVLSGESGAVKEVLRELVAQNDYSLLGSKISFTVSDGQVHARPHVHDLEIVPSVRKKQLASGRLSETRMPAGERNEFYQDYIASAALRVAGDIFQVLPFDHVYVTCMAKMLDSKTGHMDWTPILSVQIMRSTFKTLNHTALDPSDVMKNFRHEMTFLKTKGFSAVTPLLPV